MGKSRRSTFGAAISASQALVLLFCCVGCGAAFDPPPSISSSVEPTASPLVAEYSVFVPSGSTVSVEFGPDTNYGFKTSSVSTQVLGDPQTHGTTQVKILVAGMRAQMQYHMRARVEYPGGVFVDSDHPFTTGGPPANYVLPKLQATSTPGGLAYNSGIELLNMVATDASAGAITVPHLTALATDLQGNLIWYYDPEPGASVIPIRPLPNGHMLVNVQPIAVREIDLSGKTIREILWSDLSAYLQQYGITFYSVHHDVLELPNGHWVLLFNMYKSFTDLPGYPGVTQVLGDGLVDLDQNLKPDWVWSSFDHLDVNRHPMSFPDWTHCNAIVYSPNDGNLLLSSRHQSWVMKIDYQNGQGTGSVLWRLGYQGDFSLAGGDPSQWFYAQHFPNLVSQNGSEDKLMIMDNGDDRVVDSSGDQCGTLNTPACFSRGVVVNLDEGSKTANIQWQYDPGIYSFWGGSNELLPNGNLEFDFTAMPGSALASRIVELTPDGNPNTVWQLDISGYNAYRGQRIPSLYPGVQW